MTDTETNMYTATVFAKRRHGTTREEFSIRFRKHGKLAGPIVLKHSGQSYIQRHMSTDLEMQFNQAFPPEQAQYLQYLDADGIITLTFPTMENLIAFLQDPAHAKYLNADVAEFADTASVRIAIALEHQIVTNNRYSDDLTDD